MTSRRSRPRPRPFGLPFLVAVAVLILVFGASDRLGDWLRSKGLTHAAGDAGPIGEPDTSRWPGAPSPDPARPSRTPDEGTPAGGAARAAGPAPVATDAVHETIPSPAHVQPAGTTEEEPSGPAEGEMVWSVDPDGIRAAVDEASPHIIECYDGWLRTHPGLQGKLVVTFTVDSDAGDDHAARVSEAALLRSDLDHPVLEGCILSIFSAMWFEHPEEGKLTVRYPFVFSPGDAGPQP